MSGTATEFTAAAAARLDDYLGQIRAALAAAPDLDPFDIEADVREHVAAEFRSHTRPVALVELEGVLAALGPPAGWATAVARPAVEPFRLGDLWGGLRRVVLRFAATLWHGPEDWRLAYLCQIVTVLAVASMGILLPVAYLLGRAAVALAKERGQPLGARAWLVYPAILAVSVPLFLAVTLGPGVAAYAVAGNEVADARNLVENYDRNGHLPPRVRGPGLAPESRVLQARRLLDAVPVSMMWKPAAAGLFLAVGVTLAWWALLGVFVWAFPDWPAVAFFPLLAGYDWLHGVRLAVCSTVAFVAWASAAQSLSGYRYWV